MMEEEEEEEELEDGDDGHREDGYLEDDPDFGLRLGDDAQSFLANSKNANRITETPSRLARHQVYSTYSAALL